MRDVCITKWFGFWSIWFAIGLHSPNHANHGKPIMKVWIVLPPEVGAKLLTSCASSVTVGSVSSVGAESVSSVSSV